MARRLCDVLCAALALVCVSPLLALAALGIRLASPGPVLYRARRVGRLGRPFTMLKLRTMHVAPARAGRGARITATVDPRVFPFGAILRRTKIDELPQLINVLRGDMAIVGPRPEDPAIVRRYYGTADYLTLRVRPGLASPGSLFQYTHGDALLAGGDPERRYVAQLLPIKLALDLVYVSRASWRYDAGVVLRTCWVIAGILLGRRSFRPPRELHDAQCLLAARRGRSPRASAA